MAEYREQFELLSLQLEDVNDGVLIIVFVNGLDECTRAELLVDTPTTVQNVIKVWRLETKNQTLARAGQGPRPNQKYLAHLSGLAALKGS